MELLEWAYIAGFGSWQGGRPERSTRPRPGGRWMLARYPRAMAAERYGGRIKICDYDPVWPAMFEQARTQVQDALGSTVVMVEHVAGIGKQRAHS